MRHVHKPVSWPKHSDLMDEVNDMCIAIKIHHCPFDETVKEAIEKARATTPNPTWDNVVELLNKCYRAINEQREDPRKY